MATKKHTHMYKLRPLYPGRNVWACHLPDCSHYMPLGTSDAVILGKNSICWQCGREFKLSAKSFTQEHPTCSIKCAEQISLIEQISGAPDIPTIMENQARKCVICNKKFIREDGPTVCDPCGEILAKMYHPVERTGQLKCRICDINIENDTQNGMCPECYINNM